MDKTLALKLGGSLASASALAGGGYLIYDSVNPTLYKKLSNEGYKWSPVNNDTLKPEQNFGLTINDAESKNLLTHKSCSKNFFPSLPEFIKTENNNSDKIPQGENTSNLDNEKGIGCLIFSIGKANTNEFSEGLSSWEIALKKGNYGFLLKGYFQVSAFLEEVTNKTEAIFLWFAVQLKKENEIWRPLDGVRWNDSIYTYDFRGNNLKVDFPSENSFIWKSPTQNCIIKPTPSKPNFPVCHGPDNWNYFGFSALWEENKDQEKEGKEIFEIIDWKNSDNAESDIWGSKKFNFEHKENVPQGWRGTSLVLNTENNSWNVYEGLNSNTKEKRTFFDATSFLQTAYSPFAKKKGTLTDIETYCSSESSIRNTNDNFETTKFKNICMSKQP